MATRLAMDAMERFMHGRTTLMIAHCVGTLSNCDAQPEIEDSRVVRFEHNTSAADAADKSLSGRPPAALFQLDRMSLGRLEEAARLFRDVASCHWTVDLDFEMRCLPLVEQLLMDAIDENGSPEKLPALDALASGLGCFVGETIRRNAGITGCWHPAKGWGDDLVIEFEGFILDPIGKARAFLHRGPEDSVVFYANDVLEQLNGNSREKAPKLSHRPKGSL